ncbi:MAG: hypothetical protein JHC93_03020 [Parachlamydiales bacterium]|nr:hypothetical protein [Parachlamydiales bacterium]
MSAVTFQSLPTDLYPQIFCYLNQNNINLLSCINKFFYRFLREESTWKQLVLLKFGKTFRIDGESSKRTFVYNNPVTLKKLDDAIDDRLKNTDVILGIDLSGIYSFAKSPISFDYEAVCLEKKKIGSSQWLRKWYSKRTIDIFCASNSLSFDSIKDVFATPPCSGKIYIRPLHWIQDESASLKIYTFFKELLDQSND